jgi:hypothetical protein
MSMILAAAEAKPVELLKGGEPGLSWAFAMPVGPLVRWDDETKQYEHCFIDDAFAQAVVRETKRAMAHFEATAPKGGSPYQLPITAEHLKPEELGHRRGDLLDVRFADIDGKRGIWLLGRWTDAQWASIEVGEAQYVSIHIGDLVTSDGMTFGVMVRELSVTSRPRFKTIGRIQDTLSLKMAEPQTEHEMLTPEEIKAIAEATATAVAQAMAPMMELIDEMSAKMNGEEEETEPPETPEAPAVQAGEAPAAPVAAGGAPTQLAANDSDLKAELAELKGMMRTFVTGQPLNTQERSGQGLKGAPTQLEASEDDFEKFKKKRGLTGRAAVIAYQKR